MTKKEKHYLSITNWLESNGWKITSYGHYELISNGSKYRMKFQKTSIRFEKHWKNEMGGKWYKIASDYVSKIFINDNNQLVIDKKVVNPDFGK